jgi:hypothetical protein
MDEAAPGGSGAAAEKKRPLLRRFPTAVGVTLLGVALTARLLPAFTRQWDDRQRARDLKAGLVAEIASATSQALVQSREAKQRDFSHAIPNGTLAGFRGYELLEDSWLRESIRIESEIRAYLPHKLFDTWRQYDNTIEGLFQLAASHVGPVELQYFADYNLGVRRAALKRDLAWLAAKGTTRNVVSNKESAFSEIVNGVEDREQTVTDAILSAHVAGYSTTTHDLIHDLIP